MIQNFYGSAFRIDDFSQHYSVQVGRLLETGIPTKPGVVELLDFLDARGLPLAVATSAGRTTAEHHLGQAGLLDRFTAMATRDDVARAKPHPDVYLEAARRLGVAPERCIAFEDFERRPHCRPCRGYHGDHGARHPAADARGPGEVPAGPARPSRRAETAAGIFISD